MHDNVTLYYQCEGLDHIGHIDYGNALASGNLLKGLCFTEPMDTVEWMEVFLIFKQTLCQAVQCCFTQFIGKSLEICIKLNTDKPLYIS